MSVHWNRFSRATGTLGAFNIEVDEDGHWTVTLRGIVCDKCNEPVRVVIDCGLAGETESGMERAEATARKWAAELTGIEDEK